MPAMVLGTVLWNVWGKQDIVMQCDKHIFRVQFQRAEQRLTGIKRDFPEQLTVALNLKAQRI